MTKMKVSKGDAVYVEWMDITADLHSDAKLEPAAAEVMGWVDSVTKKYIRLSTCRYKTDEHCDLKDQIAIPMGCVERLEIIG